MGTESFFAAPLALGRDKGCSHVCRLRRWVQLLAGKVDGRGERMRAVIDGGLYIDGGLISGLEAMSKMRELLDELYGDEALPEIPSEE